MNIESSLEIESLKKTIEKLKIEESSVSIDLYAKQREVDNLTWLLIETEQIIFELLKTNTVNKDKLEKILEKIRIYTAN